MNNLRVGVLLQPQFTTYESYAQAVRQVEATGVDTIWDWDHLLPPYRKPHHGSIFEGWTLLAAMAALTSRAEIGCLVTCNSFRNPSLLANMAKTVDHISSGRLILGIGAGWLEYEYRQYGYAFDSHRSRLEYLGRALPQIKERWARELPLPVRGQIPILIGGEGEQITLKLAAQYADIWNGFSPAERFKKKSQVLDRWCAELGRDPAEIERSVLTIDSSAPKLDALFEAGARHIIVEMKDPWDFSVAEMLVRWRETI